MQSLLALAFAASGLLAAADPTPQHGHGPPPGHAGGPGHGHVPHHPPWPPGHHPNNGPHGSPPAPSQQSSRGPCDIYASGNTPCVAAHSTTRALYGTYTGPLYDVIRGSDNLTIAISPMEPGGVAEANRQDDFCAGTTCLISMIYDQSGHGNDLRQAPSGGAAVGQDFGFDFASSAVGAPVSLNGQKAYGVFVQPFGGYRVDNTHNIAVGNEPEGIYGVLDGTHYNGACCFDYGNAERNNLDNGAAHMEALYFGTQSNFYGSGAGSGPWIMADMENGLYSEGDRGVNYNDPTINYRFVNAIVKGDSSNLWSIRGGNAQSGNLGTFYSGKRPNGYYPLKKEGAIILGIGGDNSDGSQGTFYEGAMTKGYPADATENAVQANIVAAKYGTVASLTSGPPLTAGSDISLQAADPRGSDVHMVHHGSIVQLENVTPSSGQSLKKDSTFKVTVGNYHQDCFSYESVENPGHFLRHSGYKLYCDPDDGSMLFAGDSTFCPETGFDGQKGTTSFRSITYPTRYWRRYQGSVYIGANGGPYAWDNHNGFTDQTSWFVRNGLSG